jgi:PBP1b-binding outer membrane lipoprotein LpoB
LLASLSATLLLGACASEPTATEREFGDSVRQMISAQTYDPATLSTPPDGAIDSTDGQLLEGALEAYRTTVSDQSNVGNEITISVGQ